jgi:hypothetical protein
MTPEETSLTLQKLLELSQSQIACGPECQQAKQEKEWQQRLQQAKENVKLAPAELRDTEEKYYAFLGEKGTELQRKQKEKEAQLYTDKIRQAWETQLAITQSLAENTNIMEKQYEFNKQALSTLDTSQQRKQRIEQRMEGDIFTNQRRAYYTRTEYENLQSWGFWLFLLYYITWIMIIIFIPMDIKLKIAFSIFPLLVNWIDGLFGGW